MSKRKSKSPSKKEAYRAANKQISEINSEYFVASLGGNPAICHEEKDQDGRRILTYLKESGFRLLLRNRGQSIPDGKGNTR